MITEVPPMAAVEPKRPRVNRAALDPNMAMMAEQLDDLRDGVLTEVRGMRADMRTALRAALGMFAIGGLVTLIGGGGVIYYTLSLFGELRGVDTSRAAESTSVVIGATSDAVTDVTTTPAPEVPAPTEE